MNLIIFTIVVNVNIGLFASNQRPTANCLQLLPATKNTWGVFLISINTYQMIDVCSNG